MRMYSFWNWFSIERVHQCGDTCHLGIGLMNALSLRYKRLGIPSGLFSASPQSASLTGVVLVVSLMGVHLECHFWKLTSKPIWTEGSFTYDSWLCPDHIYKSNYLHNIILSHCSTISENAWFSYIHQFLKESLTFDCSLTCIQDTKSEPNN